MNKKKYETPRISKVTVEVESGFMSASVIEPTNSGHGVSIKGHEISHEYGFSDESDFEQINKNEWD